MSLSLENLSASGTNSKSEEKEVQTVIKVYPFVLDETNEKAQVTSDKKFCTVLSLDTSKDSKLFYSLLQYCPFHEIQENNIRIIDLPRKTRLHFTDHNIIQEEGLRMLSLVDDDGVAEICTDMIARMRTGQKRDFVNEETQTDLMVRPYLLEEPRVATVYLTTGVQATSGGCGSRRKTM